MNDKESWKLGKQNQEAQQKNEIKPELNSKCDNSAYESKKQYMLNLDNYFIFINMLFYLNKNFFYYCGENYKV